MQDRDPRPEDLDPIERASVDELRALQLRRVQWSLRHAYDNVPQYRKMFEEIEVHPDDLRELADLAKFPLTDKAVLRANYRSTCSPSPASRSPGCTPRPARPAARRSWDTPGRNIRTWAGLMARSIRASGGRRGDRVHVAYGYGLFTGGLGAHYGAEELGCTVIPVSGGMTERQVMLITDFKPDVIMVTPSYMLAIVDEPHRQGVDPRSTSLAVGIFGAEPWTQDLRREIEQQLDNAPARPEAPAAGVHGEAPSGVSENVEVCEVDADQLGI